MEDTTESIETVETPEVETETVEVSVDDMSDEEFASHMDGDASTDATDDSSDMSETTEGDEPEEVKEVDLDQLYADQLDDRDMALDKPLLIKVNGNTHTIDNVNEMRELMERGLNYTKKMQDLASQRKELEEGINRDVDTSVNAEVEVETIASDILNSNYADDFKQAVSMLPEGMQSEMRNDASLLQDFYTDVQSGLAQKIMPQVERLMSVNNMSFEQAYFTAGQKYDTASQTQQRGQEQKQMLRSQPKPTTSQVSTQKSVNDMSDTEFDKYFSEM